MLGAIFVGLSGMEAYSKGLKTISNNVANLDTLGYKSSTISFSDLFGGHASGLAYGSGQLGGSTGNGVRYNQEHVDFKAGSFQQTGNKLDLSILGNGFLVVQNKDGDIFYTRTGQFSVDSDGYVASQGGQRLSLLNGQGKLETVNINNRRTSLSVATGTVTFSGSLNASSSSGTTTPATFTTEAVNVYDDEGTVHAWTATLTLDTTNTDTEHFKWKVVVTDGTTTFTTNDSAITYHNDINGLADAATLSIMAYGKPVTLNFAGTTTRASSGLPSDLKPTADGRPKGALTDVAIDDKGQMVLTYSNKDTVTLGSVALADFQDLQSLDRIGGGLFKYDGTGEMAYRTSNTDGIGTLQTGQVEASNVDLTAEFGSLILIQRGFDASSQVISASNDMIQALFGMRGHG